MDIVPAEYLKTKTCYYHLILTMIKIQLEKGVLKLFINLIFSQKRKQDPTDFLLLQFLRH